MPRNRPIEISTNTFHRSHGRAPKGHGAWGFIVMDYSGLRFPGREVETFFAPAMTLTDAKVWAKSYVREHYAAELKKDHVDLEVAP